MPRMSEYGVLRENYDEIPFEMYRCPECKEWFLGCGNLFDIISDICLRCKIKEDVEK